MGLQINNCQVTYLNQEQGFHLNTKQKICHGFTDDFENTKTKYIEDILLYYGTHSYKIFCNNLVGYY